MDCVLLFAIIQVKALDDAVVFVARLLDLQWLAIEKENDACLVYDILHIVVCVCVIAGVIAVERLYQDSGLLSTSFF
jgi:hypothetical protein